LQHALPDTKVRLTVDRGGEQHKVLLEPVPSQKWFNPERGLSLENLTRTRRATSMGEAVRLGWDESASATLLVFKFLRKIKEKPRTAGGIGGPISIVSLAGASAKEGLSALLLFMTMISANLAVINFLPIPVLDGGHMVFLAYEGIRGRPPDERVFTILTMTGFALLLALMVFAFWLDITRLIKWAT
jgi:regulator of sigma E protease